MLKGFLNHQLPFAITPMMTGIIHVAAKMHLPGRKRHVTSNTLSDDKENPTETLSKKKFRLSI